MMKNPKFEIRNSKSEAFGARSTLCQDSEFVTSFDAKFEIRNSKHLARGLRVARILNSFHLTRRDPRLGRFGFRSPEDESVLWRSISDFGFYPF